MNELNDDDFNKILSPNITFYIIVILISSGGHPRPPNRKKIKNMIYSDKTKSAFLLVVRFGPHQMMRRLRS